MLREHNNAAAWGCLDISSEGKTPVHLLWGATKKPIILTSGFLALIQQYTSYCIQEPARPLYIVEY